MSDRLELIAVPDFPIVSGTTPVGPLVCTALELSGHLPVHGDILVVAHKVVSKAEGRIVDLKAVDPGVEAQELAARTGKDARLVESILRESTAVVRAAGHHLIMEHRLGFVSANAAVDQSNAGGADLAILVPLDPDWSAREIRTAIARRFGAEVGVIVSDTHGRPFRRGAVGVALGVAGTAAIESWRGRSDLDGRLLETSEEAVADELAGAASLLMGQGDEGRPLVLIRGYLACSPSGSGRDLLRERSEDLFRPSFDEAADR